MSKVQRPGGRPQSMLALDTTPDGLGAPLDSRARALFEHRLGVDFGRVRIHSGVRAIAAAAAVDALAYSVGSEIVLGGQFDASSEVGVHILAHELAHVLDHARHPGRLPLLRRTSQVKIQVGKGKAASTMTVVVGGVEFSANAKADVLKSGGLLPGPDQAHVAFAGNRLAYDIAYTAPQDPFRWSKIKDLIDSDEKINVEKVALSDNVKVRFVTPKGAKDIEQLMMTTGAAGLTLPTETVAKAIYPNETSYACSPRADAHQIYYTASMSSSVAQSELAHELLGHMWLAIKRVPFGHPKDPKRVKAIGMLEASHGIQDPLGAPFAGKVEDFIRTYVSSQSFAAFASPTQFVSPALFAQALTDFKSLFTKGASKKPDGSWAVSDAVGLAWEKLSNNFRFAPAGATPSIAPSAPAGAGPTPGKAAGPKAAAAGPTAGTGALSQAGVVKDLATWYRNLTADQKYVLERMLDDIKRSFDRNSDLATAVLGAIKP
ncbi:MAG TPA: DUF4157 domain-containing protein [Dehalococcoidia bacterium]|nr:DUF4157 domain-containing protein [Dehalococcoidia bacterium]